MMYRIRQSILLAVDALSFVAGLYLALSVRALSLPSSLQYVVHLRMFGLVFVCWLIINYINGLYETDATRQQTSRRHFFEAAIAALIVGTIFFYIIPTATITPKTVLALTVVVSYLMSFLLRAFIGGLIKDATALQTSVLLIGYTLEVQELISYMNQDSKRACQVVALLDPEQACPKESLPKHIHVYHSLKTLRPAVSNHNIDLVVAPPATYANKDIERELYELLFWPVQITDFTSFYEDITGRIPPISFSEGWFLEHIKNTDSSVYAKVRFVFDMMAAIALGMLFVLCVGPIALAIRLSSKGPVFFTQTRVGLYGEHFQLYKFRTMYALSADGSAETNGYEFAKKNDSRITTVGKFLRKSRLDELPQVINLFKQEISLIGPRPERPEIVKELTAHMPYYPLRQVVRPGMTGWAVLHQNYTDTIEKSLQKLQYDLYYIKNRSFLLDMSIVLKTVNLVVRLLGQ